VTESRDYLELSLESIKCFADDGKLDADELAKLLAIAQRDGAFDTNELRVLRNVISRIRPEEFTGPMRGQLAILAQKLGTNWASQLGDAIAAPARED
jgi:hypothetical protein